MRTANLYVAALIAVTLAGCAGGGFSQAAGGAIAPLPHVASPSPGPTVAPTATPRPALSVTPAQLSFGGAGAPAQVVTAHEDGYGNQAMTESDTCSGIAIVNPHVATTDSSGTATFTVSPTSAGSCSITVTDSANQQGSVGTVVTQPTLSPISLSPNPLNIGNEDPVTATFTISEPGYSGAFTLGASGAASGSSCAGIATITPMTAAGPNATITVTQPASPSPFPFGPNGTCYITITDANGQYAQEVVNSTYFGVVIE